MPPPPEGAKPVDVMAAAISHWKAEYVNARLSAKRRAAFVVTATTAASGLIAILGALTGIFSTDLGPKIFSVVTTAAGAFSSALIAWNEHFRHRDLWVIRSTTVAELEQLQLEFDLARAARKVDSDFFSAKLNKILHNALDAWIQIHGARGSDDERNDEAC